MTVVGCLGAAAVWDFFPPKRVSSTYEFFWEALDLCDEWKFNPDESLLETGNEEEESVEEYDSVPELSEEEYLSE